MQSVLFVILSHGFLQRGTPLVNLPNLYLIVINEPHLYHQFHTPKGGMNEIQLDVLCEATLNVGRL